MGNVSTKLFNKLNAIALRFFPYEGFMYQHALSLSASTQVKKYTSDNLYYSLKVAKILRRLNPRPDKYLTKRHPSLTWTTAQGIRLVALDATYSPEGEIRIDDRPYEALFNSLVPLIEFAKPASILEIGCTSGNLLNHISRNYSNIFLKGVEIFEFLRAATPAYLRENIYILDLRFPLKEELKSDLVICLEVAEHIDPTRLDVFLDSISTVTSKYLVMSWSDSYPPPDAPPQHLAPLTRNQYKRIMKNWGFIENRKLTRACLESSNREEFFHHWWRKSLIVWEKQRG
jgi:SAM-dependent methyltransferase